MTDPHTRSCLQRAAGEQMCHLSPLQAYTIFSVLNQGTGPRVPLTNQDMAVKVKMFVRMEDLEV